MFKGKKTYAAAIASVGAAVVTAYLGIITWDDAFKFIQTAVIGSTLRGAIG